MANNTYPNFVLENKFEDQYNSYLDLMQFCTVDDSLVGTPGMIKKIRVYTATSGNTETLAKGEGNSKTIEVDYNDVDYTIEMLQNRFAWFDEELMEDPLVVDKGLDHQAVDMFNTANAKAVAEFAKATKSVPCTAFNFEAFVDGIAGIDALEIGEAREFSGLGLFALAHKDDVAAIRKALGEQLKYVEAHARTGYIGTVAGVVVFVSALATKGTITIATKKAVTYFVKKGTEAEQERDANIRKNTAYLRKYGIFALTNQNYIVRLVKGA